MKASKNVIKGYTIIANSFINVHDYNTEAVQGNEVKLLLGMSKKLCNFRYRS